MTEEAEITLDILKKYDKPVPRYTSFPSVPFWTDSYSSGEYIEYLDAISSEDGTLSIYVHVPFCVRRCLFCGCNVVISRNTEAARRYLDALSREVQVVAARLGQRKKVSQLHLGGGTPTHLTPSELRALMDILLSHFDLQPDAELSAEVHPSVTTPEHVTTLADLGFNRLSMGVQDLDPLVQKKVNRFQTEEETRRLTLQARDAGFLGVNMDLIYGLPYQTFDGFRKTLKAVVQMRPDRLAVYSYAHLPEVFKHQRSFPPESLPDSTMKLELFLLARNTLLQNGYRSVGFDHFSLPTDELWRTFKNRTLRRNFMGYTTQAGTNLIGFGVSAIGDLTGSYAQNARNLLEYHERVERGGLATTRGIILSEDDLVRRTAIMNWLCMFEIDAREIVRMFGDAARPLLQDLRDAMPGFETDGLVVRVNGGWRATGLGRILARIVAASLDPYLRQRTEGRRFSSAV